MRYATFGVVQPVSDVTVCSARPVVAGRAILQPPKRKPDENN